MIYVMLHVISDGKHGRKKDVLTYAEPIHRLWSGMCTLSMCAYVAVHTAIRKIKRDMEEPCAVQMVIFEINKVGGVAAIAARPAFARRFNIQAPLCP